MASESEAERVAREARAKTIETLIKGFRGYPSSRALWRSPRCLTLQARWRWRPMR